MIDILRVTEIFRSIQGESTRAGLPCVFVRLAGCNLRCAYCDSRYAAGDTGAVMSTDEVRGRVEGLRAGLVCITGGEPLLQPAVCDLAARLLASGRTVLVETNGTQDITRLPKGTVRVMDVKCPGSGECGKMRPGNLEALEREDEVKFVLSDRADFEWAADFTRRHELVGRCHVLFSPLMPPGPPEPDATPHGAARPRDVAQWILESGMEVRLQVQLHKILWPEKTRGV